MSTHLWTEIEKLKKKTLLLGATVEECLQKAVLAIERREERLAREVIASDDEVDKMEVEVEEDCLKVLALYQPVAGDLRFIVSVFKINNDLERIGDLAVNIAERALVLLHYPRGKILYDFAGMAAQVRIMLKQSLDALVNLDDSLAGQVCAADDKVDAMNRNMYCQVMEAIQEDIEHLESYINLLSVSRYLERIADHATNIAEDVIYLKHGSIVRHRMATLAAEKEEQE